jgi:rhamnopyranosyl-N-acetylglucosaminyl-diphospho-decaprenol beta-1,3/1,4-galactofuranosyltransferase
MAQIAAVIVTYNRLNLLKKCIESLHAQTVMPDKIIVINNGSTDGTGNWLDTQKDLHVIHGENIGSAGGFNKGMKQAYGMGYEWIWVMDDDGFPDENCLETLLHAGYSYGNNAVLCPVCLVDNETGELSFHFRHNGVEYNHFSHLKKDFAHEAENYSCFMNGILFKRSTIEKCGLPRPEYFIWGDEDEYTIRIREHGIKIVSILAARFFHPKDRMPIKKYIGNSYVFAGPFDWKAYCYFRNWANMIKDKSRLYGIRQAIVQFVFYLLNFPLGKNFRYAGNFLSAYLDGLKGDFSKKLPF